MSPRERVDRYYERHLPAELSLRNETQSSLLQSILEQEIEMRDEDEELDFSFFTEDTEEDFAPVWESGR